MLEMVTIGCSHIVLSLALVGLEIYTLIAGSCTDVPSLQVRFSTRIQLWNLRALFYVLSQHFFAQFTHAIPSIGCLWSDLCVKDLFYEASTSDTNALLTVHDK